MTRQKRPAEPVHCVYVIQLEPGGGAAGDKRRHVYVGETALTPEERFSKHMSGGRTASPVVQRRGRRLLPELTRDIGPFSTRIEALKAEAAVAARLRADGFVVHGGQGRGFMKHD